MNMELTPAEQKQENIRKVCEKELENLNEALLDIGITMHDYTKQREPIVQERINDLVNRFRVIDNIVSELDIMVPYDVINYLENGKNPDLFTRDFIERAAAENHFTKGKIAAHKDFYNILKEELNSTFPEDMKIYDNNLEESSKSGN
ncbi:hypothetical protein CONCODRAFT_77689 [Conidiobolus coronatus NRRL 28638]|uniref:Mediator of RNA polymerase II transcription subunit 10 n=1 Tax=Conidiobolus coronatus (strain ATCC 28846 / CBS 209.66 / NRRL 28638) TaxID=796925 RepID=A0A137PC73_CONC2|nr:hypothetical protein CONCODRAFT_77689 [Conidiobolus coronatus NRRL 28638]|eukprot:KXN72599.1 hypothetical protein CONCODRAFT_77689 [Conidiobolus coronatus NRRL 28638]